MGMLGEHLALAVYPGEEGMDSYRLLRQDRSAMNDFEQHETMFSQNCVMCSFENKDELRSRELDEARRYCQARRMVLRGRKAYPRFQRLRPHHHPWYLDDAVDQACLQEGLEACLEVSRRLERTVPEALGLTEGAPFGRSIPLLEKKNGAYHWSAISLPEPLPATYPSPEIQDDIMLAKLGKIEKRSGEWACDIFMHVQAMSDEADDDELVEEPKSAPFFPYLLLIVENQSGLVLDLQISSGPVGYAEEFVKAVLKTAQTWGKPPRILVCNERTQALFLKLAKQLGTKLVVRKRIPQLEEIEEDFFERFYYNAEDTDEPIDEIMSVLGDSEQIKSLPNEILLQLSEAIERGVLPADAAEHVRKECRRRKL
jgi:hypothetical protein